MSSLCPGCEANRVCPIHGVVKIHVYYAPGDVEVNIPTENILQEAAKVVDGPRQDNYGHPKVNFKRIADLWSVVFDRPVTSEEVAMCLIQVNIARNVHAPKRDNLVDIAGYARCLEMLSE